MYVLSVCCSRKWVLHKFAKRSSCCLELEKRPCIRWTTLVLSGNMAVSVTTITVATCSIWLAITFDLRWFRIGSVRIRCSLYAMHLNNCSPIITSTPERGDEYVCLSARRTRKPHNRTFFQIFVYVCLWPWHSSPLTALRYVICFRFYGWRHVCIPWSEWKESRTTPCLRVRQVAVPVGRQTTAVFGWVRQNAALGAKSAIYDSVIFVNEN